MERGRNKHMCGMQNTENNQHSENRGHLSSQQSRARKLLNMAQARSENRPMNIESSSAEIEEATVEITAHHATEAFETGQILKKAESDPLLQAEEMNDMLEETATKMPNNYTTEICETSGILEDAELDPKPEVLQSNTGSTRIEALEDNSTSDFDGTDSDTSYHPEYLSTSLDSNTSISSSPNIMESVPPAEAMGSAVRNLNDSLGVEQKPKKRIRNEANWSKNKKKTLLNSGLGYTTEGGLQRQGKHIGRACGEKCKLKCSEKFNNEQRQSIFKKFYALADRNRQRDFLSKCMVITTPRKYRIQNSSRKLNYAYYLYLDEKRIRVCKAFFKSTIAITNTAITTTQKKMEPEGTTKKDLRGHHSNHKTLPEETKQSVRNHIYEFPRVESHYCRADTKRQYLEGDLSISVMYRLYLTYCTEHQIIPAKHSMYSHIFNTEYNLSFYKPKKDQCAKCAAFTNASPEEKDSLKQSQDNHLLEKTASRSKKNIDVANARASDGNIQVYDYDLQAVVPLPLGEVSTFFYKSKLNFINFTLCDVLKKSGICYSWHEGIAKRGANEIGTCVYLFLKSLGMKTEVIFYSDNCAGQNKNKFILSMYLFAVQNLPIDKITHNFLITGHTQNDADNIHSVIEREKKRLIKKGPIYTPAQMAMVLKSAKKSGEPYTVYEMSTDDFYNWKELSSNIGKNYNTDEEGKKVAWGEIKSVSVEKHKPFVFEYKTSFINENAYTGTVNVKRKQRGRTTGLELQKAYLILIPPKIGVHKKRDLLSLCASNLIPKCHHAFFESLPVSLNETVEMQQSSSDSD